MERWKRNLYVISAAEFLTILGFTAIYPFMAYFIQELGITDLEEVAVWAGLVSSAPALTMAVFAPIWGVLADRYGRKLMLERAIFGAAVCLGLMGLTQNVHQLFAVRVVQGCLTGSVGAATTLVAATTPREKAGYGLGLIQMAIFAGASFGPLAGGFIADSVGYRTVFWFTALVQFLAGMCVVFYVSEDFQRDETPSEQGKGQVWAEMKDILRSPLLLAVIVVSMAVRLADASVKPMLPIFIQMLVPEEGRTASIAGSISAVSAVTSGVAAVVAGRQGDRVGYRKILLFSTICACILLVPQALVQEIWQLFVLRALVGACVGGTFPVVSAVIAVGVAGEKQGVAHGLNNGAGAIGRSLGPILGAAVATTFGFRAVFIAGAVLFGLVSAGVAFTVRDKSQTKHPS
ncbi:MAG: MFS transporter [Anaerolineae bacterium]|nr:MFS transporter [Anaerolineae bacterium]